MLSGLGGGLAVGLSGLMLVVLFCICRVVNSFLFVFCFEFVAKLPKIRGGRCCSGRLLSFALVEIKVRWALLHVFVCWPMFPLLC